MAQDDKYTVLVVPEGGGQPVRRYEVRGRLFGLLAALGVVVTLILVGGGMGVVSGLKAGDEIDRLRQENAKYEQRIEAYERRAEQLDSRLGALESAQERMRELYRLPGAPEQAPPAEETELAPPAKAPQPEGDQGGGDGGAELSPAMPQPAFALGAGQDPLTMTAARLEQVLQEQAHLEHALSKREDGAQLPSGAPVATGWVSSGFGERVSPFTGQPHLHTGVDIVAPVGTPVVATAGGTVVMAGRYGALGRTVQIDHGDGLHTRYGHNKKLYVRIGQEVRAGAHIADVGRTGQTTGPHLHYEVLRKGDAVDPAPFLGDI